MEQQLSKISYLSTLWDTILKNNPYFYAKPRVLVAIYKGELYVVASDDKTVYYFLSKEGKVFVCVASKCKIQYHQDNYYGNLPYYLLEYPGSFQIVSCRIGSSFTAKIDSIKTNIADQFFKQI